MSIELQKRKKNRLTDFDYSQPGDYFITICTKDKKPIFGSIAEMEHYSYEAKPEVNLSRLGSIVNESILNIATRYPYVIIDKYVIMPNHVHMIISIKPKEIDLPDNLNVYSNISTIIGQFKRHAAKQAGSAIWQKGFYDHVIRDESDYFRIVTYIDENPLVWSLDKYYCD